MVVKRTHRKTHRRRSQHRRKTYRKKRINTKRNKVRRKQRTYKKLKGGSSRAADIIRETRRSLRAVEEEDEDLVPLPPAPIPLGMVESAKKLEAAARGARLSSESARTNRADKVQFPRRADDASWQEAAQKAMDEKRARILKNSETVGKAMRAEAAATSQFRETPAERRRRREARKGKGKAEPEGSTGCCGVRKRGTNVKQEGEAKKAFAGKVEDVQAMSRGISALSAMQKNPDPPGQSRASPAMEKTVRRRRSRAPESRTRPS